MPELTQELEKQFAKDNGFKKVAGIDEVGRGPLAGPVVVSAVVLPGDYQSPLVQDSKKLTEKNREIVYEELIHLPNITYCVIEIAPKEIDELNILGATHKAMRQSVERLKPKVESALIDGLPVKEFPLPQLAVVKGDSKSLSIAAASIIAKVTRDRLMVAMDDVYPEYGFAKHKGYPTKQHIQALEKYGPTPIHRKSFAPVAKAALSFVSKK